MSLLANEHAWFALSKLLLYHVSLLSLLGNVFKCETFRDEIVVSIRWALFSQKFLKLRDLSRSHSELWPHYLTFFQWKVVYFAKTILWRKWLSRSRSSRRYSWSTRSPITCYSFTENARSLCRPQCSIMLLIPANSRQKSLAQVFAARVPFTHLIDDDISDDCVLISLLLILKLDLSSSCCHL